MEEIKDNPKWSLGAIVTTFGLKRLLWGLQSMPLLEKWVAAEGDLTEAEGLRLEQLRKRLLTQADNWNEEELKMYFVAFVLEIVGYLDEENPYHAFFEQSITATINQYKLSSKPDMLLAKGVEDELYTPYLCFHEYTCTERSRSEKSKPDKDPRAQLIIDMLIAQSLNHNGKPIYGCYVAGKFWSFVVLDNKELMISKEFDATKTKDLHKFIFILRHFWVILRELLG